MYILNTYKQLNPYKSAKEYRKELKALSPINLRRSSKSNLMGVIGALKVLENHKYPDNLPIYIASEYGCMEDMIKVLGQVNNEDDFVMPFDFLNINGNNTGYLISKAIETNGNNSTITSEEFSFEKAFEQAYNEFNLYKYENCLLGAIDESLENIPNYNNKVNNIENLDSIDGNCWLHLSKNSTNSIAKIEHFELFTDIKALNNYLNKANFEAISLNQNAKKHINDLNINKELVIHNQNDFFGTVSAANFIDLINSKNKSAIHISLDLKNRAYLFQITK